jgi:ligand-binding SRPBCC domain-containing protein
MATFSMKTVQKIPVDIETAWEFFSSPANLQKITPNNLGFKVLSKHHGEKMYHGQIIEYKVKPVNSCLLDD